MTTRCEGWTKAGIFTMGGNLQWTQCKKDAIVSLAVIQDDKKEIQPACKKCWQVAIDREIEILSVLPIDETQEVSI